MRKSFLFISRLTLLLVLPLLTNGKLFAHPFAPEEGKASYYADYFEGRKTAYGEFYRRSEMTAAHKTLPFGTIVRVTHLGNQKSVEVRINDRGPFVKGRIIDLSRKAAEELGIVLEGVAFVKVEVILPDEPAIPEAEAGQPLAEMTPPAGFEPLAAVPTLADKLTEAQLPIAELPATGFSLEIGQYHHLGNIRSVYLSLGEWAIEPVYITEGTDAEGTVYHLMVGLARTREEIEAMAQREESRFSETQIIDWDVDQPQTE
jgi:rare lipoprotein A